MQSRQTQSVLVSGNRDAPSRTAPAGDAVTPQPHSPQLDASAAPPLRDDAEEKRFVAHGDAPQAASEQHHPAEVGALREVSRRNFIATALAATGAMVLGSFAGAESAEPAQRRYGMVIDTKRCVGCKACVIACKAENKTPPGVYYTVVFDQVVEPRIDDKPLFTTKPCFHCDNPPCVDACPVSATFKREQDGIVVVDYDRCIGCRYCMTACPYSARWFDFDENYVAVEEQTPYASVPSPEYNQFRQREKDKSPVGNVRKCTFCLHLQDENGEYSKAEGRWPACAKTCTGHAIHFGDLNDPQSDVFKLLRERVAIRLKEELGTEPNVFYLL